MQIPAAPLRKGVPLPLNERLKVGHNETTASRALELRGCSAGSVDLVVILLHSLSRIEAILEGGLDDENYVPISSTVFTGEGFARFRFRGVAFRFLRLYYTASGSPGGVAVVATTVHGT